MVSRFRVARARWSAGAARCIECRGRQAWTRGRVTGRTWRFGARKAGKSAREPTTSLVVGSPPARAPVTGAASASPARRGPTTGLASASPARREPTTELASASPARREPTTELASATPARRAPVTEAVVGSRAVFGARSRDETDSSLSWMAHEVRQWRFAGTHCSAGYSGLPVARRYPALPVPGAAPIRAWLQLLAASAACAAVRKFTLSRDTSNGCRS